jgi:hypothetical protein
MRREDDRWGCMRHGRASEGVESNVCGGWRDAGAGAVGWLGVGAGGFGLWAPGDRGIGGLGVWAARQAAGGGSRGRGPSVVGRVLRRGSCGRAWAGVGRGLRLLALALALTTCPVGDYG